MGDGRQCSRPPVSDSVTLGVLPGCNPPCPVVDLISTNGRTEATAWPS